MADRFTIKVERLGDHDYAYVHFAGGQVQVKLDDEGAVVNLWDSKGNKCLGTLGVTYQELNLQACEDCSTLVPVVDEWDGEPVWCIDCYNAALQ